MEPNLRSQLTDLAGRLRGVQDEIFTHQRSRRLLYFRSRERTRRQAWSYAVHLGLIVWVLRGDADLAAQLAAQCSRPPKATDLSCSSQMIAERGLTLTEECKNNC